jgi:hypothetical protein
MTSPRFDFTRYKTQGKGHGFVEVFARRLKTDRVLRQRVMVAKIKELANLARAPEDDPEVQWAHVQEVQDRLYELTTMEFEIEAEPEAQP